MKTPIYDFLLGYSESGVSRFHMPGHKGRGILGIEGLDVTEVSGADVLYSPSGIISESEREATRLFGSRHSFYSTEGSTLAVKAMLTIAARGKKNPVFLAARNVHKAFVYGVAMLDGEVEWLFSEGHICHAEITPDIVEEKLGKMSKKPCAVYVTSPDYLGNVPDIEGISRVCDGWGIPLLVDNAHGAYRAFLNENKHPLGMGASMCCDSAHKTLPVLTGGAYLHISRDFAVDCKTVRDTLALYASTSPSYLVLASLDLCNKYISENYGKKLSCVVEKVAKIKAALYEKGFCDESHEELKISVNAKKSGYTGYELCEILREVGGESEFADEEYLVLMLTAENTDEDFSRLLAFVNRLEKRHELPTKKVCLPIPEQKISIRQAVFSLSETVDVKESIGRVCASPTVSCPPAVPIAISGEVIKKEHAEAFLSYGINKISVVK